MIFEQQHIAGVYIIKHNLIGDERGGFYRTYCAKEFEPLQAKPWVQMNHSFNAKKGTLRGMHYQKPPHTEQKQIRCIKGEIFDVFIDLRKDSNTFLQWGSVTLSSKNDVSLFLPEGIAHGFITLEDNTEVLYNHSNYYNPEFEAGIRFDDPLIAINWPFEPTLISNRDQSHLYLEKTFKGLEI